MPAMKNKIIILSAILLLVIVILWSMGYIQIACVSLTEIFTSVKQPQRLENIPSTAIWYGGRDGGVWIDFIPIDHNDSCFECYIYNDFTGEQNSRAWWDNNIYCLESGDITIDSLKKNCAWFDGSRIGLKDGRLLTHDLSLFYENLTLIKPGMSEEEVKALLGTSYYLDYSDSTFNIWKYDIPATSNTIPKIYFNKSSKLVEKVTRLKE